jgi:hypothetical protein
MISERFEHPCLEKENEKIENIVYAIETSMEPKNSALRLWEALGGKMENPENYSEFFPLGQSLSNVEEECPAHWVPYGCLFLKMIQRNGLMLTLHFGKQASLMEEKSLKNVQLVSLEILDFHIGTSAVHINVVFTAKFRILFIPK